MLCYCYCHLLLLVVFCTGSIPGVSYKAIIINADSG
jgi:hypothetical protein